MKKTFILYSSIVVAGLLLAFSQTDETTAWIRINQLGYTPGGIKVAVWCGKGNGQVSSFQLINAVTNKPVFTRPGSKNFGAYGPFDNSFRLDFSLVKTPGRYYLQAGNAISPVFDINDTVYKGTANFCLQYMRQQRSGFNPFLKDSCHTHDGYTMYGTMPDSTHINVSGGWHDASDYLQYSATSANATWHLLAAYRDFAPVFPDEKMTNGLDGKNGVGDVLDEAAWGLQWLMKMHPHNDQLFNQLGDDRDHMGLRIPKEDSFYGKGYERPVYFVTGEPQGLFKYKNRTKGTSSTAAKFASAFALAAYLHKTSPAFKGNDSAAAFFAKAMSAYKYALKKPGVTQTAPGRAPYFYEEDNWVDDMELAAASIQEMNAAVKGPADNGYYAKIAYRWALQEKTTPWLGKDTARHYQWYPFINAGHYELAKQFKKNKRLLSPGKDSLAIFYRQGIQRVWEKAKQNAFYRGIPFIWCSNNLTTSFAIQCHWYRQLSNDTSFAELEQANLDWLFGCNPWGTSMVYGLPGGDTPVDPHSAFTHLKQYPINGGLVDGPVYTSIYKNLIGIHLQEADEYEAFQSGLAVYHDDFGDYSTNEPTMDGTASLIYLLAAKETEANNGYGMLEKGAIIRGNTGKKELALVFTGDEFADGGNTIANVLQKQGIRASFFLTGRFYRNPTFRPLVKRLHSQGNYLGPHSDQHLLYCDWNNRDSLLIDQALFNKDLADNLAAMKQNGIPATSVTHFLPPYEWYNDSIASWTKARNMQLINYTPGTLSAADYTYPPLKNYRGSAEIFESIINREKQDAEGLNGYILLLHIGTDPRRTDKFYNRLDELLTELRNKGYRFKKVNELLK